MLPWFTAWRVPGIVFSPTQEGLFSDVPRLSYFPDAADLVTFAAVADRV
jgi:hypothetical protein